MKGLILTGTTILATSVLATAQADIVPNLPKDLKTTCTIRSFSGSGFSTYGPPRVGDTWDLDLTKTEIPAGRFAFKMPPGTGHRYSNINIEKPLKLAFSEWQTNVYGARYAAGPDTRTQILVTVEREGGNGPWRPAVVIQERAVYGWEWLAPATARLVCDRIIPPVVSETRG